MTLNTPTVGSIIAIIVAVLGLFLSAFNSDSEIAYFLWQVAFQLLFYSGFNTFEVLAKILNLHDY